MYIFIVMDIQTVARRVGCRRVPQALDRSRRRTRYCWPRCWGLLGRVMLGRAEAGEGGGGDVKTKPRTLALAPWPCVGSWAQVAACGARASRARSRRPCGAPPRAHMSPDSRFRPCIGGPATASDLCTCAESSQRMAPQCPQGISLSSRGPFLSRLPPVRRRREVRRWRQRPTPPLSRRRLSARPRWRRPRRRRSQRRRRRRRHPRRHADGLGSRDPP